MYHKVGGLKQYKSFSHSSRSYKSKIKDLEPCSLQRLYGIIVPCLFFWLLVLARNLWHSLACKHIALISAYVVTWHSILCLPVCSLTSSGSLLCVCGQTSSKDIRHQI
jgi:hypothetical protein